MNADNEGPSKEELAVLINELRAKETLTDIEVGRLQNLEDLARSARVDDSEDLLLSLPFDHDGHARAIRERHNNDIKWCSEKGWMIWDGKCWNSEHSKQRVTLMAIEVLRDRQRAAVDANRQSDVTAAKPSSYNIKGTLSILESHVVVSFADFDKQSHLLNCNNGVVDLRTGEIAAHDREQLFTYCLETSYDPSADSALWERFLQESVESPEVVDYLRLAVGYSITGYTSEEIMFFIHGPKRSGKGTFTETLMAALRPSKLATEVGFETFVGSRVSQNFDLAPLKSCRFVSASESKDDDWLNGEMIKRVTGGNEIYCAFKYGNLFSYRPQFKIWLTSNYAPKGDPDNDALWGRLRVVQFPTSKYGREDRTLKEKLIDSREGILKWAISGAIEWYADRGRGLPTPKAITDNGSAARDACDHVQDYIDECCVISPETFTSSASYYQSYELWCRDNGHTGKKQNSLTRSLTVKGFERKRFAGARGLKGFGIKQ